MNTQLKLKLLELARDAIESYESFGATRRQTIVYLKTHFHLTEEEAEAVWVDFHLEHDNIEIRYSVAL